MESRRQRRSIALNRIPPLPIPHRTEYPLSSRMHLVDIHPRLEAKGRPFPCSPGLCSCVNLRVLKSLTRGPQGQPSPREHLTAVPEFMAFFPLLVVRLLMVGPWFTTPSQLFSQSHGAVVRPLPHPPLTRPHNLIPSLIPCFYPTGPPATGWRGPTGSSSIPGPFHSPCTGRSYSLPFSRSFPYLTPDVPRTGQQVTFPRPWPRLPFLDPSLHPVPHPAFMTGSLMNDT